VAGGSSRACRISDFAASRISTSAGYRRRRSSTARPSIGPRAGCGLDIAREHLVADLDDRGEWVVGDVNRLEPDGNSGRFPQSDRKSARALTHRAWWWAPRSRSTSISTVPEMSEDLLLLSLNYTFDDISGKTVEALGFGLLDEFPRVATGVVEAALHRLSRGEWILARDASDLGETFSVTVWRVRFRWRAWFASARSSSYSSRVLKIQSGLLA
jgi:hypothetical protein